MKGVDIDLLRPANFFQVIVESVDIGILRPDTIPILIKYDMLVETYLGHNISATLPLVIR